MTKEQFNGIVLRYHEPVISVVYKMVFSWEVARDLAQDTFCRFWNYQKQIDLTKPVFTLLYKIAMNIAIDYLRKQRSGIVHEFEENLAWNNENDEDIEFQELVFKCSKVLQPKQRAIFVLRDLEGMTFEEISLIMKSSIGNIRSNLHLARKNIKRILFEKYQITEEYFNDL
ncbi:RNA polymerase sigma factor [Calditrichota bacterium]